MGRQQAGDPTTYGPYSQSYNYDQWGNMTTRVGWGGWNNPYRNWNLSYSNNRLTTNPATGATLTYDASGNLTEDGNQSFTYDVTGQQATASGLANSYDGDRLRVKKVENSVTTYYVRSTILGGQVLAELNASGTWTRGYVYMGGQMIAIQSGGVNWVHQDPVTKSQRVTNSSGTVVSTIDVDPWGGETGSSNNPAFQPHRFASYERDANGGDDAMMRRYAGTWMRFSQPDPYDGSYDLSDPQSFNRYSYVQNDPVSYVDPLGLDPDFGLGPPPPVPTLIEYGDTIVTNISASRPSSGGPGFFGDDVLFAPVDPASDGPEGPQNPEYPPPRPEDRRHMLDDCHFLAATADELAAQSSTDTLFVRALRKRFVPPSNQDSPAMREFRAGGFKGRFNDDESSYNQVRHFVGAFSNAFYGGLAASLPNISFGHAVREAVNQALKREGPAEYADKRLSATTVPEGVALAYGLTDRKDLGNFIRNNVCGTSW